MNADKTHPAWKRFLDRIRTLWETPARKEATPKPRFDHAIVPPADDGGPPISSR
jgi:hypothetical protein